MTDSDQPDSAESPTCDMVPHSMGGGLTWCRTHLRVGSQCEPGSAATTRHEAMLRLHLGSEHALANWLDTDDPEEVHRHEHEGPGTIRNHPAPTLVNDPIKAVQIAREALRDE